MAQQISQCDDNTLRGLYQPPPLSPPPPSGGGGGGPNPTCQRRFGQGTTQEIKEPGEPCSPILIDTAGDQFELTSVDEGIAFDLAPGGELEVISWTSPSSDDAWLALDRSGNGTIDDGSELFGNFTPQPSSTDPNGFRALQYYDTLEGGGNGDGTISSADDVYLRLRLWTDTDHDGVTNEDELSTLPQHGILGISLNYANSPKADEHGNAFRYAAALLLTPDSLVGPYAVDVFLVAQ